MTIRSYDPVLFLYGSQHFLRRRFLSHLLFQAENGGWRVERASGEDQALIRETLGTAGLFSESTFLLVHKPEKLDEAIIESHAKDTDPTVVLLLYYEGMPKGKFAKFVKKHKDKARYFESPSPFKEEEVAIEFCMKEADKSHGMNMPHHLAKALVIRVGCDFGVLAYEVQKICLMAEALGTKEIAAPHLQGVISEVMEVSVFNLVDHLSKMDLKRTAMTLSRIQRTHAGDPTMAVSGILSSTVLQWLSASSLLIKGVSGKDAAKRLGVNPYRYKNFVQPCAQRWGPAKLRKLVRAFAEAQRNVMSGVVSPWNILVCRLLEIVQ